MHIRHFTDLRVYQSSLAQARQVFEISKAWPKEERHALTDQIRRSSRSIGANLAESWGKRRYEAHFISKLSDADAENHETEHWLICARDCGYLSEAEFDALVRGKLEIGGMIGAMIQNPAPFLVN